MSSKSRRSQPARTPREAARSGNPARRHAQPAAPPARRTLERLSAPVLIRLHAMPRFIVPVLLAAVLFGGLVIGVPWLGAVLLVVVALFVSWLTALSWPVLTPSARLIRVVVCVALFGIAVSKGMGRF